MMTLREIHEEAKAFACKQIKERGIDSIVAMFIGFAPDDQRTVIAIPMPSDPEARTAIGQIAGSLMRQHGCWAYAFMSETWLSRIAEKRGLAGEILMPSEQPDRCDGLAIITTDQDRNVIAAMFEVRVVNDGAVMLEPWHPETEAKAGDPKNRFEGRFMRLLDMPASPLAATLLSALGATIH